MCSQLYECVVHKFIAHCVWWGFLLAFVIGESNKEENAWKWMMQQAHIACVITTWYCADPRLLYSHFAFVSDYNKGLQSIKCTVHFQKKLSTKYGKWKVLNIDAMELKGTCSAWLKWQLCHMISLQHTRTQQVTCQEWWQACIPDHEQCDIPLLREHCET